MSTTLLTTRMYLEGYEVDLSDNSNIAVNYSIDDVKDISLVTSPFTQTITVPGTAQNNKLFNFLYNPKASISQTDYDYTLPNIGNNFDFKRKCKADIIQDNQVILGPAYAQLLSATSINGDVSYDLQLTSEMGNFISSLANLRLEDVPNNLVSQYTLNANLSDIHNSWHQTPSTAPIWPLIDYGFAETCNATNFYLSNLRPSLFAKQYLDLIFQQAGFTYSSNFLTSEPFTRMVCPYKEGTIGGQVTIDVTRKFTSGSLFLHSTSSNSTVPGAPGYNQNYIFDNILADPLSQYDPSQFRFAPTSSGLYNIEVNIPYQLQFNAVLSGSHNGLTNTNQTFNVVYEHYNSSNTLIDANASSYSINPFFVFFFGNTVIQPPPLSFPGYNLLINAGEYVKVNIVPVATQPDIRQFNSAFDGTPVQGTTNMIILPSDGQNPYLKISNTEIIDYSNLSYFDYCLKDVKQIEFFESIIKMFNLYVVQDKNIPRHFNIYTRDEFYANQTTLDWTNKIDTQEKIKIQPIPSLKNQTLSFKFKEDKDYYNKLYTQNFGGVFGQKLLSTGYQFSSDTQEVLDGIIFSPTVPVEYRNDDVDCEATCEIPLNAVTWNGTTYAGSTLICTSGYSTIPTASALNPNASLPSENGWTRARPGASIIYFGAEYQISSLVNNNVFQVTPAVTRSLGNVNGTFKAVSDTFRYRTKNDKTIPVYYDSTDGNFTRQPLKTEPKIAYWSGMVSCSEYRIQATPFYSGSFYTHVGLPAFLLVEYPYISNLAFPHDVSGIVTQSINPVANFLFATPTGSFFTETFPYPEYNLYTGFWRNTVNEMLDNESKLLTANMKLSSMDISQLDFSNVIAIDGTNYRLNSINQYTPDDSITTECGFVRLPFQDYITAPSYLFTGSLLPPGTTGSLSMFVSASVTSSFTGLIVNSVSASYVSGANFRISGSQSGTFATTQLGTETIIVTLDSVAGETVLMVDSNGFNTTQALPTTATGSNLTFTGQVVNNSTPVQIILGPSQHGTVDINNNATQTDVVSVKLNTVSLHGGAFFPVSNGDSTSGITDQIGINTVVIAISETGHVNRKIQVQDSNGTTQCQTIGVSGNYTFNGVVVNNVIPIVITLADGFC